MRLTESYFEKFSQRQIEAFFKNYDRHVKTLHKDSNTFITIGRNFENLNSLILLLKHIKMLCQNQKIEEKK